MALDATPGARTGRTTATESTAALVEVTTRLPKRPISQPAAGRATTAPTARESKSRPSPPSPIPSRALRPGICGTQLATTAPLRKKHSETARRARASPSSGAPRSHD
jgi:hypothetical protein